MVGAEHNRPLHLFATFTAAAALGLIFVGGLVTSTGSGLSVPDWPNTYGRFMFTFPLSDMVCGIRYEHSHRLFASAVGLLTLILAYWLWRTDRRTWVRSLGLVAVGAVVIQGLLGGLTVIYLLPTPVSVAHATLAQTFLLLVIALAYATSREFHQQSSPAPVSAEIARMRLWVLGTLLLIYLQLILGAIMRHTGSGLAFLDFPLAGGEFWPSLDAQLLDRINWARWQLELPEITRNQMLIHLLHRAGAVLVTGGLVVTLTKSWKHRRSLPATLLRMVPALAILLVIQITLGAMTVLSLKQHIITTGHVANGAGLLGLWFLFTMRLYRLGAKASNTPAVSIQV